MSEKFWDHDLQTVEMPRSLFENARLSLNNFKVIPLYCIAHLYGPEIYHVHKKHGGFLSTAWLRRDKPSFFLETSAGTTQFFH